MAWEDWRSAMFRALVFAGFKFTEKKRRNSPQKMVAWNLIELETPINGKPAPPLCWKENTWGSSELQKKKWQKCPKTDPTGFFWIHPACRRAMHWDSDPRKVNASSIRSSFEAPKRPTLLISLVSWANMLQTQSIVKRKFEHKNATKWGEVPKRRQVLLKECFQPGYQR